ncbi:hypothetical protein HDU98_012365 [Podochytrium sp. JEL0797]|nr:hypothetical protein HDU98_012365 [Podochytrium sp. JEL0797]
MCLSFSISFTATGRTLLRFVASFYSNNGMLSTAQLTDDLHKVLQALELRNFLVDGVKSDAGPINLGFLFANSLAGPAADFPKTRWLPDDFAVWNGLERSCAISRKGAKTILSEFDELTWEVVVDQHKRDLEAAATDPLFVMSDLTFDSVNPDNLTKMSGADAKAPFSTKSCSAYIGYMETVLQVSCDAPLPDELSITSHFFIEASQEHLGLLTHKLQTRSHLWPKNLLNPLPTVRVLVIFNEIFNELLLKKDPKITAANFTAMKAFVSFRLEQIDKLTVRQTERRIVDKLKDWKKTGFSVTTIRNLRICIAGLFLTAEAAIRRYANDLTFYFPVLFGTTTSDEGIFSFARGRGANMVSLFASLVAGMNARGNARGLLSSNNKAYSDEEIPVPDTESFAAASHQNVKERNAKYAAVVDGWTTQADLIPHVVLSRSDFEVLVTLEPDHPD